MADSIDDPITDDTRANVNQNNVLVETIESRNVDGIGGETTAIFVLSFILIIFLIPYQIVCMNTVYTHKHLDVSDVPYYDASLDSTSEAAERYRSIDYYVQWSDILLWILPTISIFTLYQVMVNRYNMTWLYVAVVFFIMVITWLKFAYIIFLFFACKRTAFCTNEDPTGERGSPNNTFIWRFAANFFFSFITTTYMILAAPLSKLQNQNKFLVKRTKMM